MDKNLRQLIAVFGGSFNPPTHAHIYIINEILRLYAAKVIVLPVNQKYEKGGLASYEDRVAMLELLLKNNNKAVISNLDKETKGSLRTIDALNTLKEQNLCNCMAFVIGTDNLMDLPNWKNVEELLEKYFFIVIPRGESGEEKIIKENPLFNKYKDKFLIASDLKKLDISATKIRNSLDDFEEVKKLTSEEVIQYIYEKHLYES